MNAAHVLGIVANLREMRMMIRCLAVYLARQSSLTVASASTRFARVGSGILAVKVVAGRVLASGIVAGIIAAGSAAIVLADEKPVVRNDGTEGSAVRSSGTEAPLAKRGAEKTTLHKESPQGEARQNKLPAKQTQEKESPESTPLESVLVVFESSGKLVAMRVVKEHQIAVLQACFPDFHARPKSDAAVKWAPKYEIYFNFQDGRTIRVLVSGNSRYWTTGDGELEMRGMYFSGVIHELLKANMKSGDE